MMQTPQNPVELQFLGIDCSVVAFTKTCSYADGDRCSSNETPLNLISRHQVPVVARAETPKENGVALDAVSRISRPGIAYGSWERVESLADFQSFFPFSSPSYFLSLSLFSHRVLRFTSSLNMHALCYSNPEIVYFHYDKRIYSLKMYSLIGVLPTRWFWKIQNLIMKFKNDLGIFSNN